MSLGMRSTKIRTLQREEVTIPNLALVVATMKNFSRQAGKEGITLHTTVTIGYSAPLAPGAGNAADGGGSYLRTAEGAQAVRLPVEPEVGPTQKRERVWPA